MLLHLRLLPGGLQLQQLRLCRYLRQDPGSRSSLLISSECFSHNDFSPRYPLQVKGKKCNVHSLVPRSLWSLFLCRPEDTKQ